MPRSITGHSVRGDIGGLFIAALDEPTPTGANHHYQITQPNGEHLSILFQNGPLGPDGKRTGVTMESLIVVAMDRLEGLQRGSCACAENAEALMHLDLALKALQSRTERVQQQAQAA